MGALFGDIIIKIFAVKELRRCAGSQFDPEIVDVFCRILAGDGLTLTREEEKEANLIN
ncbi:hypothetical protein MGLY_34020 [Neomoorella glycerini]|uniref:Uncharacterized protein n=1 Tax=Neomoorella glycerini TaxID=55779 RepID=A0A6I5ZWY1_9FIRM|nr:hypothetical protein [Moorella glycerini]QGP93977.1 hypothetical protein MGLY_34020 [Moorella glycerini]